MENEVIYFRNNTCEIYLKRLRDGRTSPDGSLPSGHKYLYLIKNNNFEGKTIARHKGSALIKERQYNFR